MGGQTGQGPSSGRKGRDPACKGSTIRISQLPSFDRNFPSESGNDMKTIQGFLRDAKVTTTLDLYSQSIDASKLDTQKDMALAIRGRAAAD